MFYNYNGVKIFYQIRGKGRATLFLHGWGQSGSSFDEVFAGISGLKIITLDFPPFGKSEAGENFTLFTYANMVISLCEHLKLDSVDLIGHSFGGRVAILLAAMKKELVKKLVLVSSAGMKPKRKPAYYFKVAKYKVFRLLGLMPKNAGSADYNNLPSGLKKTFVSIVSTHLEEYCTQISSPTLIIFGSDDEETPVYMAKRLNRLIRNSKLILLSHAGHFCFQDRKLKFCEILNEFLEIK